MCASSCAHFSPCRRNKHGCEMCRCVKCPPFTCDKHCSNGYRQNRKGCSICMCKGKRVLLGFPCSSQLNARRQGPSQLELTMRKGCMSSIAAWRFTLLPGQNPCWSLSAWTLMFFPVLVWIFSRSSGFLPETCSLG